MLSVDRCRTLLGAHGYVPDSEISQILDLLYGLADVLLELTNDRDDSDGRTRLILDCLDVDDRIDVEERAAILEYDGGLPRQTAEVIALEKFMKRSSLIVDCDSAEVKAETTFSRSAE